MADVSHFVVKEVVTSRARSDTSSDVPIYIGGDEIGVLCLLKGVQAEVASLTDHRYAALLHESAGLAMTADLYKFSGDYVVIERERLEEYNIHQATSAFWGQYLHADQANFPGGVDISEQERIVVDERALILTPRHFESLAKYAAYGRSTDRFLFLYHFIEIDFEREFIRRIKQIDENGSYGVSRVLKDLGGNEELPRLVALIAGMSTTGLERCANVLRRHFDVAESVFYEFGKESNPIKERADFRAYFRDCPTVSNFAFTEFKRANGSITLNFSQRYEENLKKVCAYWIYRVRCCIAHNKMGEYHMMTASDMSFLDEFALPMLREMVSYRMGVI